MDNVFAENKTFENLDCKVTPLPQGEYDDCTFISCDFSSTDLSGIKFTDCRFQHCNLSLVKTNKTALREIVFQDCKMLGLNFDRCNEFGLAISFENCTLNHASFYQTKIKATLFKNCQLQEVDFTECDLSYAVFEHCECSKAIFENTVLEHADLRSAQHYSIDPEKNKIKKARFSVFGLAGLLEKYGIEVEEN